MYATHVVYLITRFRKILVVDKKQEVGDNNGANGPAVRVLSIAFSVLNEPRNELHTFCCKYNDSSTTT